MEQRRAKGPNKLLQSGGRKTPENQIIQPVAEAIEIKEEDVIACAKYSVFMEEFYKRKLQGISNLTQTGEVIAVKEYLEACLKHLHNGK